MGRNLYLRILNAVSNHDTYFTRRKDVLGRLGLFALRMLAYGSPADAADEYIKIGESTAIESWKRFCCAVVEVFREEYLRSPNANDVSRLLHIGESRGFPGMLGSLDCMHWKWKNCPTAWVGQYTGRSGTPTTILETVADYGLWIWHAYFDLPRSNNDINVLESSHLFGNLAQCIAPPAHYVIQGKEYNMDYYLADCIYPKWDTLVQTIHDPQGPKKTLFAMKQEACRKDVERAFGVLKAQFAIIAGLSHERDVNAPIEERGEVSAPDVEGVGDDNTRFQEFVTRHRQIKDKQAQLALRNALIEHLWAQFSNSEN